MGTVTLPTSTCPVCGKTGAVTVDAGEFDRWKQGQRDGSIYRLIQNAMPSASADDREQIITGTHPECWDALFPADPLPYIEPDETCSWNAGGDPGDPDCIEPVAADGLCTEHLAAYHELLAHSDDEEN